MSLETVGDSIRRARRRAGLSQQRLALRAGTSQAAISRIETGAEDVTFERLAQIAAGLGYAPTLELNGLAEPDPTPLQLLEQVRKSPQTRVEELLKLATFARELAP
jgi:transcriptional regulator with XRE-family HTH domain